MPGATLDIQPFTIDVPEAVLEDLRARLAHTRWPAPVEGSGWEYGTNLAYLQELCRYWRDEYDWRAAEKQLNAFPQFVTRVDGERLHFLHVRSPHADALPLVMTHGWPGSVVEFMDVIGPLVDPVAHGGKAGDAFHLVCPSIPGYAWSGPTRQAGWHTVRVAGALKTLMAGLGYGRYGAQGGDWGGLISAQLAALDAEHMVGVHLNLVPARPPGRPDDFEGLTADEQQALADRKQFQELETGYSAIQGTKPQTVAYALNDSPAGLAGWIVEKFRTWSDCGGDVESAFSRDHLLTNIMAYWVTETAGSSARLYRETMRGGQFGPPAGRITVPTGVALFPKELARPPRKWVAQLYNLTHWTVMPRGGHFAAMEQPELFIADVRAFFRGMRTAR